MGILTVELIPKTVFFSNVRTVLPKKYWDVIRKESYARANHKCEICYNKGKDQGFNHDLECHEIWDFNNETRVQKLVSVTSLCPICHQVKHFGRTSAIGKQAQAFKQLETVNGWSHKQCLDHLKEIMIEWLDRSKYKWRLDLSILNELFNIPKEVIKEGEKKRKI